MISRPSTLMFVAAAVLSMAAGRQLAMRVDVQPLAADGDTGVRTAVSVRIAPEDRGAMGRDVMVWAELSNADKRLFRRGWALKIDDPTEPLRVEAVWPAGVALLKIEVEGSGGRSTGVWWGEVDIAVPEAEPETESEAAAESESLPVPVPDDSVSEPEQWSAAATAAAAAPVAPSPKPEFEAAAVPAPVPVPDGSGNEPGPLEPAAAAPAAVAPAPAPTTVSESESESEPVPVPVPVPVPDDRVSGPRQRSGTESASATATKTAAALEPVDEPTGFDPELAGWAGLDAGLGELTVAVVDRGNGPSVPDADDVVVRAGSERVAIVAVGGPDRAPLILGLVIDLGPGSASDLGWVVRVASQLTERAAKGRGLLGLWSGGRRADWGLDPSRLGEAVEVDGRTDADDLPATIADAVGAVAGRTGRGFVIVISDGRRDASRREWRHAEDAAARSGVPLLVAGIWSEDFRSGVRKSLRRLTDASGGDLFLVQGSAQAANLVDRFGAILDASTAVRVEAAPGTEVTVELDDASGNVTASTVVR